MRDLMVLFGVMVFIIVIATQCGPKAEAVCMASEACWVNANCRTAADCSAMKQPPYGCYCDGGVCEFAE